MYKPTNGGLTKCILSRRGAHDTPLRSLATLPDSWVSQCVRKDADYIYLGHLNSSCWDLLNRQTSEAGWLGNTALVIITL